MSHQLSGSWHARHVLRLPSAASSANPCRRPLITSSPNWTHSTWRRWKSLSDRHRRTHLRNRRLMLKSLSDGHRQHVYSRLRDTVENVLWRWNHMLDPRTSCAYCVALPLIAESCAVMLLRRCSPLSQVCSPRAGQGGKMQRGGGTGKPERW